MPLLTDQVIVPDGAPSGTVQQMKSVFEALSKPNIFTYFGWRAMCASIAGNATPAAPNAPTIRADSFNVASVEHPATGIYRFDAIQNTINGNAIEDFSYPLMTVNAPDAGEAVYARFDASTPDVIDVLVYTLDPAGQNLNEVPYDLTPNDRLWAFILMTIEDPGADPLPP
jgi:hypothetical protein